MFDDLSIKVADKKFEDDQRMASASTEGTKSAGDAKISSSKVEPVAQLNPRLPPHKVKPVLDEDSHNYLKMLLNAKNREFIHVYDEKLKAFTQKTKKR